jgi:hypothetical protein
LDVPGDPDPIDDLIRRIPVAVKSPEMSSADATLFCPQPLTDCPSLQKEIIVARDSKLSETENIVARDSILSATALELLLRSAKNLTKQGAIVVAPEVLQKQFKADIVEGVGTDNGELFGAEAWKRMTANYQRKFFTNGIHYSPLYSPIALVLRAAPGADTYLYGCAYLDAKTQEPTCLQLKGGALNP